MWCFLSEIIILIFLGFHTSKGRKRDERCGSGAAGCGAGAGGEEVGGALVCREESLASRGCVFVCVFLQDSVQLEVYGSREEAVRYGGEGGDAGGAVLVRGVVVAGCGAGRVHGEQHTVWALGGGRGALIAVESGEGARGWRGALGGAGTGDEVWPVRTGGVEGSLLVAGGQLALLTDTPPRVLARWSLAHIRRYGVVGGKFCLEAGARSGEHAGLHVLETRAAEDICRALDRQARRERGMLSRSHTAPLEVGFHPAWTMQEERGERGRSRERGRGGTVSRVEHNYDVPPAPEPLATCTLTRVTRDPSTPRPSPLYENMSYSHDDYLPMWPRSPDYTSMTPGRTARRRSPASCDSGVSSSSCSPPLPRPAPRRHRPRSCCEYRHHRTVDSPA